MAVDVVQDAPGIVLVVLLVTHVLDVDQDVLEDVPEDVLGVDQLVKVVVPEFVLIVPKVVMLILDYV